MATIANEDDVVQWAVFFGTEYQDHFSFKGKVNKNGNEDLKWDSPRPLWLIPISCEAKVEAERTLNQRDRGVPRICGHEIVVRNSQNDHFWYEDEDSWHLDPTLVLSQDAYLEKLSEKGHWKLLQATVDSESERHEEEWPVWLTTSKFGTNDKILTFPAPACHIVNEHGKYLNHQIWFGVRHKNDNRIVNWPFININDTKTNDPKNEDCPLVWRNDIRERVDLLEPANKEENKITKNNYNKCPFDKTLKNWEDGNQLRINKIISAFCGQNESDGLQSWMILEKLHDRFFIHPFYLRHYSLSVKTLIDKAQLKVTQISRKTSTHIFSQFQGSMINVAFSDKANLWRKTVDKIGVGVKNVLGASGFSLTSGININVPRPDVFCCGEWKTSISLLGCPTVPHYDLLGICLFNNENKVINSLNGPSISLPNISSTLNEAFTLTDVTLGFETNLDKVNDDGTLIYFVLESFKIKSKNTNQVTFGSFNFHISLEASHLDTKSKYGIFSLKLKHQDIQRPFFLWQWHNGMKDDIFISYAIEDFSLPVSKIEAAGQDHLASDKLLASASLGTSVEGFGERGDPPLIIPLDDYFNSQEQAESNPDTQTLPPYLLTFSESVNIGQYYKIDVKLQEVDPEAK